MTEAAREEEGRPKDLRPKLFTSQKRSIVIILFFYFSGEATLGRFNRLQGP